jgi:protein-L-isoaspartate(D-aspartate) O-methyltransferase
MGTAPASHEESDEALACRIALVRALVQGGEVDDARVLDALLRVPRHLFVPDVPVRCAYLDRPVRIGYGQTISQPTTVGLMTEALELRGEERVLEIGTGSGYQAAVLSLLCAEVYTIELVPALARNARAVLLSLGYSNVQVRDGDGATGWPEAAPFDRVLLTAAPTEVPAALFEQLADGGVLVAPVGGVEWDQRLLRYRKRADAIAVEDLGGVCFVPLI